MSFDPLICVAKTDAMLVIQDLISHGYSWWDSGEVEAAKALGFASKMDALYGVGLDRNRRYRRAAKGQANSILVMYPRAESTKLRWWLIATSGNGEIHSREKMKRCTEHWIQWHGYELVRLTFKQRSKPSWTWRMTAAEDDSWRARFRASARSENPVFMQQAIFSLYRCPGYAAIRSQVGHLMTFARREWAIAGRTPAAFPSPPARLYYVRKRCKEQQPLSALVRRERRGGGTWFGVAKRSVKIKSSE